MDSLALVEGPSGGFERRGLARSDPKALPLGAVVAKPSDTPGQGGAGKAPQPPQGLSNTEGCPIELPPPPSDPPILVLFPTTLHLALSLAVPPHTTILSGSLMLLTVLCSWAWGWELVSTAGLASGLTAGLVVGLGVRFWPVGIWAGNALGITVSGCLFVCAIIKWVLGIAVLGRSWPGASLGIALGLATLWKKGWWLYFHPECAALLFISAGTTADVFFGFLLASLVQVYHAQPEKPPEKESTSPPPAAADGAQLRAIGDGIGVKWTPLTPPGIGSRRRNHG